MDERLRFRTRWYRGVAFKVSITIILMTLSLVLLLSLLFFRNIEAEWGKEFRNRGFYIAKTLAQQAVEPLLYEDRLRLLKLLEAFRKQEEKGSREEGIVAYAVIYGHEEQLQAATGDLPKDVPQVLAEARSLKQAGSWGRSGENDLYHVASPIVVNGVAIGRVLVGITRAYHDAHLETMRRQLWGVAAFLIFLGILLSLGMTRKFIFPLLQMIRGARKIGEGNWGTQIDHKSRDETGELAETFNDMSRKLQAAFDRVQRTQERLIQSEKLNAIGKFSANLAHELKNPLTSIKLSIQAMSEPGVAGRLDAKEQKMVLNDIQRMDEIVSAFLSHGPPARLKLVPVDLRSFFRELSEKMHPLLDAARIRLRLALAEDLPPVFLDDRRMGGAIENLCMNAVHAIGENGEIRIRAYRDEELEIVRIDVEDTGEGIDEETKNHLFEPFYTTRKNGSGLGLSIVYQTVKDHGGDITVQSKGEQGSIFSIYLPV